MTLKELSEICARGVERGEGDKTVVLETAVNMVPHNKLIGIIHAHSGFDWAEPYFVIRTSVPVVPCRILSEKISKFASETLAKIEGYYAKSLFKYLPGTKRESWVAGFVEGVKCHITSVSESSKED